MNWLNTSGKPRALASFFPATSIVQIDSLVGWDLKVVHYRLFLYCRNLDKSCHCGRLCSLFDADDMIKDIVVVC